MKKPRIGLICFVFQSISVRNYMIQKGYVKGIIDAGGIPVLIPVTMIDKNNVSSYKGWTVK